MHTGAGDGLATALQFLRKVVDQLDSGLRSCIEELAELPHKQARQLRWSLRWRRRHRSRRDCRRIPQVACSHTERRWDCPSHLHPRQGSTRTR